MSKLGLDVILPSEVVGYLKYCSNKAEDSEWSYFIFICLFILYPIETHKWDSIE